MPREIKELLQGAPESLDELFGQSVASGVLEPNWQIRGYQSAMMRVLNESTFPEGDDSRRTVLLLAACNQDQAARGGGRRGKPLPEGHTPEGWPLSAGKFLRYAMLQVVRCLPSSQVEEPVKNVDEEAASPGSLKGLLRYARRRHLLACKGKEGWLDLATKILCRIERHPRVKSIKESLRAINEVAEATAKGRLEFVCRRLINGSYDVDWTRRHLEWFIVLAERVIAELSLEEHDPWGGRTTRTTNDGYANHEFFPSLGEMESLITPDGRVFRDMGRWREYMDMED